MITPIRLRISTAFLVKSSRPILVDTGSPGEARRIVRALEKEGLRLKDLAMILHTHGHADHCGSTQALKRLHDVPAAIHPGDARKLRSGDKALLRPTRFFSRVILPFVNVPFPGVTPEILLREDFSLREYGLPAEIVSTPGHTEGSISLVFDNGHAIAGDLLMGGYLGGLFRADEPDYHYYAEDLSEIRRSIVKLLQRGVTKFYVGHGGPLDADRVWKRFSKEAQTDG
jgi:hydroxyacylglutathione hydrolase